MSDSIIWASLADGSYGGCAVGDLIVIRKAEMTTEELDRFWEADGDEIDIILEAYDRIAAVPNGDAS